MEEFWILANGQRRSKHAENDCPVVVSVQPYVNYYRKEHAQQKYKRKGAPGTVMLGTSSVLKGPRNLEASWLLSLLNPAACDPVTGNCLRNSRKVYTTKQSSNSQSSWECRPWPWTAPSRVGSRTWQHRSCSCGSRESNSCGISICG